MRCQQCRKWVLFKQRCASCERLYDYVERQRLLHGDARDASTVVEKKTNVVQGTSIHIEKKVNTLQIVIDGKEQTIETNGDITPEMIHQLMAQTALPEAEITKLLTSMGVDRNPQVGQRKARGPLKKMHCPGCNRSIPQSAWCMYCGYEMVDEQEVAETPTTTSQDAVDRAFLQDEVRTDQTVKPRQQVTNSYKDRLKNI